MQQKPHHMDSHKTIHDTLLDFLPSPSSVWVAYSGGLDSHVLLHTLARLRAKQPDIQLRAIHINHGLNKEAAAWAIHCQKICDALQVECLVKSIDPASYAGKASIEQTARQLRYQIFTQLLSAGEYLLTAHHREDQAETVLLRLLRGAGPMGLSAMAITRPLGEGILARPLLDVSQAALEQYAQQEGLSWVEDDSNTQMQFDRNYLRHQVWPHLVARWPGLASLLARTAAHCRETTQLLEELSCQDIAKIQGSTTSTLSVSALLQLTPARQKNALRFWLRDLGFPVPSSQQLQHIQADVLQVAADAEPLLSWHPVEIRRFGDDLYAMPPLPPHDPTQVIPWDLRQPLTLPGIGRLQAGQGADMTRATIRFRRGGERIRPAGRRGSHSLKKLFQEWRVPPWLRDRVPLLYLDDKLVVVVGYVAAEGCRVVVELLHQSISPKAVPPPLKKGG